MYIRYLKTVASIWFEILEVLDPGKKMIFSGKFSKISTFQAISQKNQFSRKKLVTYSYFLANYFISLQKSPLSKVTGQNGTGQNGTDKMVATFIDSNSTELNFYSVIISHK